MKFLVLLLIGSLVLSGCLEEEKEEKLSSMFYPTPEQDIMFHSWDGCDKTLFVESKNNNTLLNVLEAQITCSDNPFENQDGSWKVIEACVTRYANINIDYRFDEQGVPVSFKEEFIVYYISDQNKQEVIYDFPKDFEFKPIEYRLNIIEFECGSQ